MTPRVVQNIKILMISISFRQFCASAFSLRRLRCNVRGAALGGRSACNFPWN